MPLRRAHLWLYGLLGLAGPALAWAARNGGGGGAKKDEFVKQAVEQASGQFSSEGFTSRPLILIIALAAMSLLPFVLLMVTSFVKISVVLSIVRNALGTQQIPPTQVITGLAVILTVYIMAPVTILGWIFALIMFYRGVAPLNGIVALLSITTYAAVGNFAAFFEIAAAVRLDGNRNRLAILPFLALGFVVSIFSVSRAALSQVYGYFTKAEFHWDKTERFRTAP